MRILIRCDADDATGLGHATRALAVAQEAAARTGAETLLLARRSPLVERLDVQLLPVGAGYDAPAVVAALTGEDILVSDTYELDAPSLDAVAGTGAAHLVIDDFASLARWPCEVVVNPNVGAQAGGYTGAAAVLAGPRYALLRREVRDAAVASRGRARTGSRVLVCLGGGAWPKEADPLLEHVAALGIEVRATRATGARGVEAVPPESLPEQLVWADVALLSGGVVKYEAAACALPAVLTAVVAHQAPIAQAFAAAGAATYAGLLAEAGPAAVARELTRLLDDAGSRRRIGAAAAGLVDGQGAARAAEALLEARSAKVGRGR